MLGSEEQMFCKTKGYIFFFYANEKVPYGMCDVLFVVKFKFVEIFKVRVPQFPCAIIVDFIL